MRGNGSFKQSYDVREVETPRKISVRLEDLIKNKYQSGDMFVKFIQDKDQSVLFFQSKKAIRGIIL